MADASTYVEHPVMHPTDPDDPRNALVEDIARAALQHKARESGRSLAAPGAAPARVITVHNGPIPMPDGTVVDCTTTVFRADVVGSPELTEVTVQAVEQPDGTWAAPLPVAAVVSVKHGLDTYSIMPRAFDADGTRTGFHGFMAVARDTVEIVPLPGAARVVIEPLPEDDPVEEPV